MATSQQLVLVGLVLAPPATTATTAVVVPPVGVRLNRGNFPLWRTLVITNLSGASLHGFLDGSAAAPAKTITEGTDDAA